MYMKQVLSLILDAASAQVISSLKWLKSMIRKLYNSHWYRVQVFYTKAELASIVFSIYKSSNKLSSSLKSLYWAVSLASFSECYHGSFACFTKIFWVKILLEYLTDFPKFQSKCQYFFSIQKPRALFQRLLDPSSEHT